ncbi:MAG TPA: hypothetical protein VGC56_00675 [Allosphingosinicella sp.]|jgi:hypothetical protein
MPDLEELKEVRADARRLLGRMDLLELHLPAAHLSLALAALDAYLSDAAEKRLAQIH